MADRYFFALWPDDTIRDQVRDVCRELPEVGKQVPRENLHLTLSFLGCLEAAAVNGLRAGAASIRCRSFSLCLDRMGWWRRPQVLWVGAALAPQPLLALVEAVHTVQAAQDIRPDARPYQAHLTIARKVARKPPAAVIKPIRWNISSFSLVHSRTLPAGAVYEVIESWPLSSD